MASVISARACKALAARLRVLRDRMHATAGFHGALSMNSAAQIMSHAARLPPEERRASVVQAYSWFQSAIRP